LSIGQSKFLGSGKGKERDLGGGRTLGNARTSGSSMYTVNRRKKEEKKKKRREEEKKKREKSRSVSLVKSSTSRGALGS